MTVLIDQLQPRYDARLLHLADVPQPPAVVRQAMEAVTLADLPALGLLVRVRNLGRRGERNPESIFSGMRHADFVHVEEAAGEIAAAMAGPLWRIRQPFVPLPDRDRVLHPDPCWALTVSSYRIEPRDAGSRFVCETRVTDPRDPRCARKFRPYWRLIGQLGPGCTPVTSLLPSASGPAELGPRARAVQALIPWDCKHPQGALWPTIQILVLATVASDATSTASIVDTGGRISQGPRFGSAPRLGSATSARRSRRGANPADQADAYGCWRCRRWSSASEMIPSYPLGSPPWRQRPSREPRW